MTTIVQNSIEDDDLSKFDESDKFTFVWKVSNCSIGELESKEFTIKGPGCKVSYWRVKLCLSSSFTVFLQNLTDEDVLINCKVSSLNLRSRRDNRILFIWNMFEVKSKGVKCYPDLVLSAAEFENLTFIFEITVLGATKKSVEAVNQRSIEEVLNHSATNDALSKNCHQGQLSQDFGLLFTSNEISQLYVVTKHSIVTKLSWHQDLRCSRPCLTQT